MNNLSKITIAILVFVTASALGLAWYEHKGKQKAENTVAAGQKTVKQAATIVNHYIDTNKRNHVVIAAAENKLPHDWYKNGTAISGGLVDTVAQALSIAKKQLVEVTQIAGTIRAEKLKAERKYDSLQRVTYYYKDKYLQMAYRPPNKGADSTDNGTFDFKYNDSLNVVQYWKKKWFLGARKSYIDIFSNDPRTTINGVSRLVVEQKSPRFGLRVQGVANYSFSRKLLNVGPGIQFDFGKWSAVGTYYYDFDSRVFRPSVGARFDFVRF